MKIKYFEVQRDLRNRIMSGEFKPGEKITTEQGLVDFYQVSRITIRRAISELVDEGILFREQGKGTFVRLSYPQKNIFSLTSCTEDILSAGYTPSRKVLEEQIELANSHDREALNLTGKGQIFKLARVFYADNETLNYTIARLNYQLFPNLEKFNFGKESLYDILEKNYGLIITRSKRRMEALFPSEKVAEYLEINKHTPVLFFSCVSMGEINGKEVAFETYTSWFRSDRYAFIIEQRK